MLHTSIENIKKFEEFQKSMPKFGGEKCKQCKSIRKAIIVGLCFLPLLPFVIVSLIVLHYGTFLIKIYEAFKRRKNNVRST